MPHKAHFVCTFPFQTTADLKPYASRPDVKWVHYQIGDPVPEKTIKASPGLLKPIPGLGRGEIRVKKVEG
jgi:hypothetical protein